ncbi:MAG: hypothetical protein ACKVII_12955 [Planctomycetales bacterium]|jgi:hypothetical protein
MSDRYWLLLATMAFLTGPWIWRKVRRRSESSAMQSPRPPRVVVRTEALVLACAGGIMLTDQLAATDELTRWGHGPTIAAIPEAYVSYLVWGLISISVAMILVLRRHSRLALVTLVWAWFGTEHSLEDLKDRQDLMSRVLSSEQHKRSRSVVRTSTDTLVVAPIPAVIRTLGHIDGVDVWLNGVHLGKTPIVTTVEELTARIPQEQPREQAYYLTRPGAEKHRENPGYETFRLYRDYVRIQDRYRNCATIKFNGQEGLLASGGFRGAGNGEGGHRRSDRVEPYHLLLIVTFAAWEKQIDLLLERARLADYQVDAEWLQCMASYRHRGWDRIQKLVPFEPEMRRLLDALATWQYDLKSVHDAAAAWKVVERVCQEAEQQRGYDTNTPAGRAIRQVIGKLDPQLVVDASLCEIQQLPVQHTENVWHYILNGENQFLTLPRDEWNVYGSPLKPRHAVLADVVWKLDRMLDGQDESRDNIVEEQIVPVLMRRFADRGSDRVGKWAGLLGGSTFEKYLLRHDLRHPRRIARVSDRDVVKETAELTVQENRWFLECARLDSPAGNRFRQRNRERLLKRARDLFRAGFELGHVYSSYDLYSRDDRFGFLFMDVEDGVPLGVEFWKELDAMHAPPIRGAAPGQRLPDQDERDYSLRHSFLERLERHVTSEMILALVDRAHRIDETFFNEKRLIDKLPGHQRSRMYRVVIDRLRELKDEIDADARDQARRRMTPNQIADNWELNLSQQNLAEDAARAWLKVKEWDHERQVKWFEHTLKGDLNYKFRLSPAFLRVLAHSASPEVRIMVAGNLRQDLRSERVAILDLLLNDPDERVVEAARHTQKIIDHLRDQPLPSTGLEPVPFW